MYQTDGTKAKDYSVLLALWTLRFALITMLALSFEAPWKELIKRVGIIKSGYGRSSPY